MTSGLREALEALAEEAPVVQVPPRMYRTARRAHRRRRSLAAAAVSLLAVLLSGYVAFVLPPDAQVATGSTAGLPDRLVEPRWWTETVRHSPNGPASVVFTAVNDNVQADFEDFKLQWWREGYSPGPTTVVGLTNDTYRIARDRKYVGVDLSPDGRYLLMPDGVADLSSGTVRPQRWLSVPRSTAPSWSADGRRYVVIGERTVSVISWPSGALDWQLPLAVGSMGHDVPIGQYGPNFKLRVALSPDGSLLAVQAKGQLRVYRRDGSLLWQADIAFDQLAGQAAWRADGRLTLLRASDYSCTACPTGYVDPSTWQSLMDPGTWQATYVNGLTGEPATGPALPAVRSTAVVRVLAWRDDTAYAVVISAGRHDRGTGAPTRVALVRLVAGAGEPQTVLTAPTGTDDMGAAANYIDTVRPTGQPAFGLNVREVFGSTVTYALCLLVPLSPVIPAAFLVWRHWRRRRQQRRRYHGAATVASEAPRTR